MRLTKFATSSRLTQHPNPHCNVTAFQASASSVSMWRQPRQSYQRQILLLKSKKLKTTMEPRLNINWMWPSRERQVGWGTTTSSDWSKGKPLVETRIIATLRKGNRNIGVVLFYLHDLLKWESFMWTIGFWVGSRTLDTSSGFYRTKRMNNAHTTCVLLNANTYS